MVAAVALGYGCVLLAKLPNFVEACWNFAKVYRYNFETILKSIGTAVKVVVVVALVVTLAWISHTSLG
jgi:hypothetical protein